MSDKKEDWHLDRRIHVGIILAILTNAAVGIWKASAFEQKLDELDRRTQNNGLVIERLVRVETEIKGIRSSIDRLVEKMD